MEHRTSAIDFPTQTRAHIALACHDVDRSQAFYEALLGQAPVKVREGYAKFELVEPPLNLTLNHSEAPARQAAPAHFGIQVKSTVQVLEKRLTMEHAGVTGRTQAEVGCCYSIQDKVWFADPDGNDWEVFVVTQADIAEHSRPSAVEVAPSPLDSEDDEAQSCCPPTCCS